MLVEKSSSSARTSSLLSEVMAGLFTGRGCEMQWYFKKSNGNWGVRRDNLGDKDAIWHIIYLWDETMIQEQIVISEDEYILIFNDESLLHYKRM